MSQQNNDKSGLPDYPRAPTNDFDDNVSMSRPAPPSYDESLKQNAQQLPQTHFQHPYQQPVMQAYQHPYSFAAAPMHVPQMYGPAGHHQAYAMQAAQQPQVLHLAKGAEVRTSANGVVSIPPPPPGYAPTPAQWAAMQGQQVLVKEQKKRSFFS